MKHPLSYFITTKKFYKNKHSMKIIEYLGLIFIIIGILLIIFSKIMFLFPNLFKFLSKGDIIIKNENFTFYFPVATSIFISIIFSIILTIIFNILFKKF